MEGGNATGVRQSSMLGFYRGKGVQKKKPTMFTVGSSTSATFVPTSVFHISPSYCITIYRAFCDSEIYDSSFDRVEICSFHDIPSPWSHHFIRTRWKIISLVSATGWRISTRTRSCSPTTEWKSAIRCHMDPYGASLYPTVGYEIGSYTTWWGFFFANPS